APRAATAGPRAARSSPSPRSPPARMALSPPECLSPDRRPAADAATRPSLPTSLQVLPVSRLALRHPGDRRLQALLPRGFRLGLGDPLQVLALVTGTEPFERGPRLGVALQRRPQIRRHRN